MPEGMLGMLPLSVVRGPKATLDERLAGSHGDMWLAELKKFLRKEPTWGAVLPGQTSPDGPRAITISSNCMSHFRGTFMRPAQLSPEEVATILSSCPRGQIHMDLKLLLVENKNGATDLLSKTVVWINGFLSSPLNGVTYRLGTGRLGDKRKSYNQIWVVDPF